MSTDGVLWILGKGNILSTGLPNILTFKTIFCAAGASIFGCKRSVTVGQTTSLNI